MCAAISIRGALQAAVNSVALGNMRNNLRTLHSRRPMAMNALFGGALGFSSDALCQSVVEGKAAKDIDRKRMGAVVCFATAYDGGINTLVYRAYDGFTARFAARGASAMGIALAKASFDALFHSPLLYIPTFFLVTGLLQGRSLSNAYDNLRQMYAPVTLSCICFWIPYQFLNFLHTPARLRVLATNCGCLAWTALIDHIAHLDLARVRGPGRHGTQSNLRTPMGPPLFTFCAPRATLSRHVC